MNPRIVVTGSAGMLGAETVGALRRAGFRAVGLSRSVMDIARPESVRSALGAMDAVDLVINCAAYTAVDKAESEPGAAFAVNRDGAANLAGECARLGIPLIHISTDYVFDGKSRLPYKEEHPVNPVNVYGLSKEQGEAAIRRGIGRHIIVRTSWLYGAGGRNFVKTILGLGMERDELRVVCDQHGCPTWSSDLADCLVRLAEGVSGNSGGVGWGTYHFCGKGVATWYEFASAVLAEAQRRKPRPGGMAKVLPVATGAYPTAAARPQYSVLDCGKIEAVFGVRPPAWEKSLERLIEELLDPDGSA